MINPWNVGCVGENPNFGFFFYFFFKKEANLGFSPTHPTRKKTRPEYSQKDFQKDSQKDFQKPTLHTRNRLCPRVKRRGWVVKQYQPQVAASSGAALVALRATQAK
jgi:hypothetical protein